MGESYKDSSLKIFSLNGNRPLAEKIAKVFGTELGKSKVTQFSDGEIAINIEESVRGDHIFIIQSTNEPVNDHYLELLIMIDAMKRASAKTINVVLPYYAYARQDRTANPHEPITAKLIANMLVEAGATRILTLICMPCRCKASLIFLLIIYLRFRFSRIIIARKNDRRRICRCLSQK